MGARNYMSFLGGTAPEDDEELQRWIAEQARSARPMPTPAPQLSSLIAPRDPAMDQRWRDAENNALSRSGYMGSREYGAGEAVRDFAPMAVGTLASLLIDKGKSVPFVLGAGMEANQVEAARRQKESQAAGDFALSARHQRMAQGDPALDAAYKQAQIENWQQQRAIGWENLGQRDVRQQFQELKLRLERDPNDPQALAMANAIKEQTGVDVVGQLGAQNQGRLMPIAGRAQDLQNAAPKAFAGEKGRTAAELEDEPETTAAAGRKAAEEARSRTIATTGAEREIQGGTPIANADVVDPGVYAALDAQGRTKANAAAQAYKVFEHSIATMSELASKHGVQNIPSGDKSRYDAAHGAALGQLTELYRTGVINDKEYERMAARLPRSGGIKESATAAVGFATGNDNILVDQIKGAGNETLSELAGMMSQYGIAPPKARPKNSVGGSAVAPTAGDSLPVVGGRSIKSTPPLPAGATGVRQTSGTVALIDPEGEEGDVPAEAVDQLLRMGYRRAR